ncbi:hypothetical protein ACGFZS_46795 [Streptomyces sp. NPDC048288]|uniref:hypothetical protein n=1 Tax=Streptomyces sp. NPDC048288 TaxID=3365529 RepID=UPI003711B66D
MPDLYGWILEQIGGKETLARIPGKQWWEPWVLRRCAGDRKLLEVHKPRQDGTGFPDSFQCPTCSEDGGDGYQYLVPFPCETVRALAEAYGWKEGASS